MRPVYLQAHAALLPEGDSGAVSGFDPVAAGIPRKSLKTMTRAVQLGVAAVSQALAGYAEWMLVPPERRGLYVGASPQHGDAADLADALAASGPAPDLLAFAQRGVPLVPPLWLVKGLSNNVLGYASATHDLRGDNGNWCDGRLGGAVALCAAVHAVAEGRVDLAIGGAADCLRGAESVVGGSCAEGAVFFVFSALPGGWLAEAAVPTEEGAELGLGELGAVAIPAALARAVASRQTAVAGGLRFRRLLP